jgi:saccharopine dehydrogenase-like NADP-dependent oxidoreductase
MAYFFYLVSAIKNEADKLASKYSQVMPVSLDVLRSPEELKKLIKNHQIVISLLPYNHHVTVAELCIKYKVNMITASYLTKPMQDLHQEYKYK